MYHGVVAGSGFVLHRGGNAICADALGSISDDFSISQQCDIDGEADAIKNNCQIQLTKLKNYRINQQHDSEQDLAIFGSCADHQIVLFLLV